ncbi:hypothetical protein SteCoe_28558 [Stentor coeruleus]|uniref:SAYSvFN domain-containing protein n=1 Tax=Stentor coeruleus TaxID=5963 RepID=A0A1R2B7X1_9CILI|nr:hypothetical protein SteCoe_28558 [Stentor coeruleus]
MKIYWKILIWLGLLYCFTKVGLGEVFCVISGIGFIFYNLGERKGGHSAYSVFNEGCQKLAGDIDPTSMLKRKTETKTPNNLVNPSYLVKNHRLANKPCPCGSGKKHKKCCLHAQDPDDD